MSNCLHCINTRNLSIHAARVQLYIYLDMNLFYCERDYIIREPKKLYTFMFLLLIRSVNIISNVHVCLIRSIFILHRPFYLLPDSSQFIHVQERSYISYKLSFRSYFFV